MAHERPDRLPLIVSLHTLSELFKRRADCAAWWPRSLVGSCQPLKAVTCD